MVYNKLMLIGSLGAFLLAVGATLVSDMHGIGDWYVSSLIQKGAPLYPTNVFSAPYYVSGLLGEPLLILSIILFTLGFYGAWMKFHNTFALILIFVGCLYMMERMFWSYVTVNFGHAVSSMANPSDYSTLKYPGFLKGMGALFGGIVGGFLFSLFITLFFFSIHNTYGMIGGIIVLVTMAVGMPAKIAFMNNISVQLVSIFMVSMVIKNVGIIFMGLGLFTESLKK